MDKKFAQIKKELNAFIAEIEEKSIRAGGNIKEEWEKYKTELRQRENDADEAFAQLEASGNSPSEEVKEAAKTAMNNLKEAFFRVKDLIKKMMR